MTYPWVNSKQLEVGVPANDGHWPWANKFNEVHFSCCLIHHNCFSYIPVQAALTVVSMQHHNITKAVKVGIVILLIKWEKFQI